MMSMPNTRLMVATSLGASAIAMSMGMLGYVMPAYVAAVIASVGPLTLAARGPFGLSSLSFLFVLFFCVYGLFGPLGAFVGTSASCRHPIEPTFTWRTMPWPRPGS